jgi:hypothetical protein
VKTWAKLTAALFLADLGLGLAVRGLIGMAAAAAAPPPRLLERATTVELLAELAGRVELAPYDDEDDEDWLREVDYLRRRP